MRDIAEAAARQSKEGKEKIELNALLKKCGQNNKAESMSQSTQSYALCRHIFIHALTAMRTRHGKRSLAQRLWTHSQSEGTGMQRPRRPVAGPTNRPYEKSTHLNRPSL